MRTFLKYFIAAEVVMTLLTSVSFSGSEGMPSMPLITAKRIYTVTAKDDLQADQGFGDQEPKVRMMNLMMVEGSGLQGMDMSKGLNEKVAANEKPAPALAASKVEPANDNYNVELKSSPNAKVGFNNVQFTVADAKTKHLIQGLKLKSQVAMTSMDMGIETPAIKEKSPGVYEVKAGFSMKGPWAVKIEFPDKSEKVFNFQAASVK